jgi:phage shock protein PspC (stress-responsive transcriptional regulator)/signal transduction histidine kinase
MKTRLDRSVHPWLPEGLYLRRDDRVIGGVCAATARWLGVDPTIVRLFAVLLALANGLGLVLYLLAWLLLPDESGRHTQPDGPDSRQGASGEPAEGRQSLERALALGLITLGALLVVRSAAPVFPDGLVWPAVVAAAGLGLVWARADDTDRARWREASSRLPGDPLASFAGRGFLVWVRIIVGAKLLILGLLWFLRANEGLSSIGGGISQVGLAILATTLGLTVLLGPWILGLIRQLRAERHERIRTEERADIAAHLHDSVLQTLALIQRQAETPQKARSLARRQERELRAWLYDGRRSAEEDPRSLAAALDRISDDVEADHDVTVDAVIVGDRDLDERGWALVGAVREAVVNAARHSGEGEVSVYVELHAPDGDGADDASGGNGDGVTVEAFVRDRGKGFVPAEVPVDRRGIADSIVGRMVRYGGRATVRSAPGEGTEVWLRMTLDGRSNGEAS